MKVKTIAGLLASVKGVVAALAFFGIISTASAEIIYVTYSGTVSDGFDQTVSLTPTSTAGVAARNCTLAPKIFQGVDQA